MHFLLVETGCLFHISMLQVTSGKVEPPPLPFAIIHTKAINPIAIELNSICVQNGLSYYLKRRHSFRKLNPAYLHKWVPVLE